MSIADVQQAELGTLVAGAVEAVVRAQAGLDEQARRRTEEYLEAPAGSLALPPLWYAFQSVSIEIQLSATVRQAAAGDGGGASLVCRTVNPATVGLYGYEAASGMTVRVVIAPNGAIPAKPVEPT
jgi:hypothetical protein